jgi:murein DD-endopeptidase MepM/ murein hydrolase activator NlpD
LISNFDLQLMDSFFRNVNDFLESKLYEDTSSETNEDIEDINIEPRTETRQVQSGDTLLDMLLNEGMERDECDIILKSLSKHFNPKSLKKDQELRISFDENDDITCIEISPESGVMLCARKSKSGEFIIEKEKETFKQTPTLCSGTIKNNFYQDAVESGIPPVILQKIIRAYSYDIDFQRDLKKTDTFEILFVKEVGESSERIGQLLYASLKINGKEIKLYNFNGNFIKPDGVQAKKSLLRTPVDGARINSKFGNRKHPILGYTKFHKGVDFGVPFGTPVHAAGDGVVQQASFHHQYGNIIVIQHSKHYSTAYAHLSKMFVKSGEKVSQNKKIGNVGTTGRTTGPHLHFEVRKDGNPINPASIQTIKGESTSDLNSFKKEKQRIDDIKKSLEK